MQFIREDANEAHAIVACTEGEVRLRERAYTASVIVTRNQDHRPLAAAGDAEALTIADFERAARAQTGGRAARHRQPAAACRRRRSTPDFAARGIGLEVMDNRAACRTYNLLLGEFRDVAVALML